MKKTVSVFLSFALLLIFISLRGFSEGTKELNTNNIFSTSLYMCNNFVTHCYTASGSRTQFATYDDTQSAVDNDRLYFTTVSANEVVYIGLRDSVNVPATTRGVFRIKNMSGTIVYGEIPVPVAGDIGYINTFGQAQAGPNQLISAPNPLIGYDGLVFTPPTPGTYYIEFTVRNKSDNSINLGTFQIYYFDITVANTLTMLPKPGRLFSKSWQFQETGLKNFFGKNYIISDDSIITSATFSNMDGQIWVQYCNKTGCGNTNWQVDRKSLYLQQAFFPQYRIFLNLPDPVSFPPATTLGQIVAPWPWGESNCNNGHILFHINVDKPGDAQIVMLFGGGFQARTLAINNLVVGENTFDWDGFDGAGVAVSNGTSITFTVSYINGLTNLPLYDVEGNSQGFTIALESPSTGTPYVFWDDSSIPGYTACPPTGCNTPPCHSWLSTPYPGFGDRNTVNTWWYNVSSSLAPVAITEHRKPGTLTFVQNPPYNFCGLSSGHLFSVNADVNAEVYHFSYTPSAGVTVSQTNPGDPFVTISFGAGATSGTLAVYATNANCVTPGPTTSIPININPFPVPTLSGNPSICTGTTGVIYTTESGKTGYTWTVSGGGTITSGGGAADNTVTIIWNAAGAQSVSVNYTDPATGCTPSLPTVWPVTVNPRPLPTFLTGENSVCISTPGHTYTTQPGKTSYQWSVSSGIVTAGGGAADNFVTVTWNTAGNQFVTVSYKDPVTLCTAAIPTVFNVFVNNLPNPSFTSGTASVCLGVTGNVYTTEAGKTNYAWTVNGGTITAGGTATSNTATITWNTVGAQSVSVNYTDPVTLCTSASPSTFDVTVKPLPAPTISSAAFSVCQNIAGNVYTTEAGMTNYIWSLTGGTITAGGTATSNTATVTWNTVGAQTISVNYNDPVTACTAASSTIYNVTVKPLPAPTISSSAASVCRGIPGNVYTTEAGKNAYAWTITGGTITSGGDPISNTATVTWNTVGTQSISVNYTDPVTLCTAAAPTAFNVTVKDLPNPTFTSGPASVCQAVAGNVYATEAGKTNYIWMVTGGTITAGGTPTSNTATVTWNTLGAQSISVNYTEPVTLCTAATPTTFNVIVMPLPVPTISSAAFSVCQNIAGNVYTTEAGMTNYIWSLTGGTITAGGTASSNTATVTWNTVGAQTISVNYNDPVTACTAVSPAIFNVTVKPLPAPTISSLASSVCKGIPGNVYTTEAGKTAYTWTITGGTITSGGDALSNTTIVTWNNPGVQSISVNYTDPVTLCTAASPTVFNVTVKNLPTPSFTSGPASVCLGIAGNIYTTEAGKTSYVWSVPASGTITAGGTATSNTVTITWNTVGAQTVSVNYTDPVTLCTAASPTIFNVSVKPLPSPTLSSSASSVCQGIAGNVYTTEAGKTSYVWSLTGGTITAGGTATSNTATVTWNTVGAQTISVNYNDPVTACTAASSTIYNVTVKPLPVPTISSPAASVCRGIPGNVYTTEAGKNAYAWTITGGTITSGGDPISNTATVTWNTVGTQSISVNYTDPVTLCTAAAPTAFNVTVKDLPNPTFTSGPASVCQAVAGNVYATEAGKTNYTWTVTGGTITAGGTPTSNTATVTWNTLGTQNISVGYTDPVTLCTSASPTVFNVTVKAVPVPTITGALTVCLNTPGYQYFTEPGKSNYTWIVTGGTTSAGPTPDIINVLWTSVGVHTISVDYTDADGCNATTPTVKNVSVNILPVPSLTGLNAICTGITTTYNTDPGMSNYTWTISAGASIISGGTAADNFVTLSWTTAGVQSVSVNYSLGSGCTASAPTVLLVTVNQSTPPTITASLNPVCESFGAVYMTQPGMSAYTWTVSAGGTVTSGGNGSNFTGITWNTTTNQSVQVNFTNTFGCIASSPATYNVTINPLPVATIIGPASFCINSPTPATYQTSVINPLTSYTWQLVTGTGNISPSATSNPINITWNATGSAQLQVSAMSAAGCPATKTLDIAVNSGPNVALTSCIETITNRSAKRFILKGGSPLFPPSASPQGEYLISPSTAALQYDALSGNYYFNPSLVPGVNPQTFTISYKYTNQFGCQNSTGSVQIQVLGGTNPPCGTSITDPRDGMVYATTLLGNHCWMAENLNYKKGQVPNPLSSPMTDNCLVEKYCPPSDPTCSSVNGAFYQWDELVQYQNTDGPGYQGLCPPGWHVPTESDWQWLIDHADPSFVSPHANALVGSYFKDTFMTFKALMTGVNYLGMEWDFTSGTMTTTMFWTSTPDGPFRAIARGMNDPYNHSVSRYASGRDNAFPVRCIKD